MFCKLLLPIQLSICISFLKKVKKQINVLKAHCCLPERIILQKEVIKFGIKRTEVKINTENCCQTQGIEIILKFKKIGKKNNNTVSLLATNAVAMIMPRHKNDAAHYEHNTVTCLLSMQYFSHTSAVLQFKEDGKCCTIVFCAFHSGMQLI